MQRPTISVSAPSRIHFGLFAVGDLVERQFGGMGLMIEQPRTTIFIRAADTFSIVGDPQNKIRAFIENWIVKFGPLVSPSPTRRFEPGICLEVIEQPPQHQGLGSGTQLAMAIATALFRHFDLPLPQPAELASAMGRAGRSAVGTHGFFHGGLLVDRGTSNVEPVAPLDFQSDFPMDWPIVISLLRNHEGLHGTAESLAFKQLPVVSDQTRREMIRLVNDAILPAVISRDYDTFAQNVYKFGRQSGLFFQSVQGGPYNGDDVARLVDTIRDFGIGATGQSSWGPCVFSICPDSRAADRLCEHLDRTFGYRCDSTITFADNKGARTEVALTN